MNQTFRSLRIRNFRLFFFGQLISQTGNWLTLVAQTLFVLKLRNNGVAVGVLTAFQFGPVLLFGAFAGLVADRSDKRRLLLIVQVVAMVQSFALALLALVDRPSLALVYAVAFVGGTCVAFDNPARRAFVVEMVPEEDLTNAVGLNSALMTASRVVGPALAGLLITTVGYSWAFAIDGFSYLAVLVGLWLIRPAELRRAPVAERARGQIRDGLRYVRGVPELWVPLVMMILVGTFTFNFTVVMPLLVKQEFGGTDRDFTILFSVLSVGSLVGALGSARRRDTRLHHLVLATTAFGVSMLVMAAAPSLGAAYPIGIVVGYTSIFFLTASTALVQLAADPVMRGRVLALQAIVFLGSTPIGGPILGVICDAFGPRAGFVVGGVAAIAAGGVGLLKRAQPEDDRRRPAAEPASAAPDLAAPNLTAPNLTAPNLAAPLES